MDNARLRALAVALSVAPYYDTVTMMLMQDMAEALLDGNMSRTISGIAGIISLFAEEDRVDGLSPFIQALDSLYELCIQDSLVVEVTSVRVN